jgi:hypothetical protein
MIELTLSTFTFVIAMSRWFIKADLTRTVGAATRAPRLIVAARK